MPKYTPKFDWAHAKDLSDDELRYLDQRFSALIEEARRSQEAREARERTKKDKKPKK